MSDSLLFQEEFKKVVNILSNPSTYETVYHRSVHHDVHMPSVEELQLAVELLRSVIFPRVFFKRGNTDRHDEVLYWIGPGPFIQDFY